MSAHRWLAPIFLMGASFMLAPERAQAAGPWDEDWQQFAACGDLVWSYRLSHGGSLRSIEVRAENTGAANLCGGIELRIRTSDGKWSKTVLKAGSPPGDGGYQGWIPPKRAVSVRTWRVSGTSVHPRKGSRAQPEAYEARDAWTFTEAHHKALIKRLKPGTYYTAKHEGKRCSNAFKGTMGWDYIDYSQRGRHGRTRLVQDVRVRSRSRTLAFEIEVTSRFPTSRVWTQVPLGHLSVVRLMPGGTVHETFGTFHCVELRVRRGKPFHIRVGREQDRNPEAYLYFLTRAQAQAAVVAILKARGGS